MTARALLAANVRRLRTEAKLSQEGLAAMCGLHRTYISHLETMRSNVTLDTLDMLANTLGASPADLLRAGDL
ncbi:MAG: helix-turn-helix transcriptional regulator [Aquabacterium sp.]